MTEVPFHDLALEGCDRCSARAKFEVTLMSGFKLRFCGHHWDKYGELLSALRVKGLCMEMPV